MQCIQFHRTLQDEGIRELCADLRAQLPPKGCWHAQLRSLVRFFEKTEKRLRGTSLEESPPAESLKHMHQVGEYSFGTRSFFRRKAVNRTGLPKVRKKEKGLEWKNFTGKV